MLALSNTSRLALVGSAFPQQSCNLATLLLTALNQPGPE